MTAGALRVRVVRGSLTDGDESVLVNASNTNVALGAGVSAAIRAACGEGYQEHIRRALEETFGRAMEPGEVLVTDAGAHPRARWVAHVAVMDYREGASSPAPSLTTVEAGCRRLWEAVESLGEESTVAMVALGAGTGGLGVREPTRVACETLRSHEETTPGSVLRGVTFYGWSEDEEATIAEVVRAAFPGSERG